MLEYEQLDFLTIVRHNVEVIYPSSEPAYDHR